MSVRDSRMRRFHDCLDAAIEAHIDEKDDGERQSSDHLFAVAVLEQLAEGCRQMGLPQAWCVRVASYIPSITNGASRDTIESVFKSAYLRETLKTIPLKFTRPSALVTYKTEAYMKEHFNDRLSMKSDNDIFLAMSSYALINIDEFDAMSKGQQPILKYLISKHDVKFRPPYGKVMEER